MDYSGTRATPRLELGVAAQEFIDSQDAFIGTKAFPIFNTKVPAAAYPAITRETVTRRDDAKRSTRGTYNRITIGAKDKTFKCEEHGLEGPLGDDQRKLYASDFDAELQITQATTRKVLIEQEARIATLAFDTATFTGAALYTNYSSSAPWATAASDVIGSIRAVRGKIRQNCGMEANALICSKTNIDYLLGNTAIKAAIQYVSALTEQNLLNALAGVLGLQKILVGKAVYNSAKEGQSFSGAEIWSATYALLGIVPDNGQDLSLPAVGRTFLWTEDSPENATVESYRDDGARSDIFRVRQHTDEVLVDAYFGHLMKVA